MRLSMFVESGADINAEDNYGLTALGLASGQYSVDIGKVRLLIDHGADTHRQGWTRLMWAALLGDFENVRGLIEHGADVNAVCNRHETALMKAASSGHLNVVQYLLGNGADADLNDQCDYTALHSAASRGHLSVVRCLINNGADVCYTSSLNDRTALHDAAESGHLEVVRYLLEKGTAINAISDDGSTALVKAAWRGHSDVVRLLVERGIDVNATDSKDRTALSTATDKKHLGIVRYLLSNGAVRHADWYPEGYTTLMDAALLGDLDVVRDLINCGVNVNVAARDGTTPLMNAANYGHMSIVRLLLSYGADVNTKNENGSTALLRTKDVEIARYLLDHEADPNAVDSDECSSLMKAVWDKNLNLVRVLVEHGANVNATGEDGWSALMFAAENDSLDIASYLIEHGADVNSQAEGTKTALTIAAKHGSFGVICKLLGTIASINSCAFVEAVTNGNLLSIRLLLEHGVNINGKSVEGETALMKAVSDGNLIIVEFLSNQGADINAACDSGSTALMHAANLGLLVILRYLIDHGANASAVDNNGWTALMWAASSGHVDIVKHIIEIGENVDHVALDGSTLLALASKNGHTHVKHLLMQHLVQPLDACPDPLLPRTDTRLVNDRLPAWLISSCDTEIKQVASTSSIGGEFIGTWLDSDVLLKMFVPDAYDSTFNDEIHMWHQLRHPNVLKLYGACNTSHHFFVCEYAKNGSAVELLERYAPNLRTPYKYLHHVALGLVYLHERGIVHGNLRGDNILVGSDGFAKLSHFCVSKSRQNDEFKQLLAFDESIRYTSPEELVGNPASFASDVYSLGLCAVMMVTQKLPWGTHCCSPEVIGELKLDWRPESSTLYAPAILRENLRGLMKQMCCHDPQLRVCASACAHIFERLAEEETNRLQNTELEPEVTANVHDYLNGALPKAWATLQSQAEETSDEVNDGHMYRAILHDLEESYNFLEHKSHSSKIFDHILELILDILSALNKDVIINPVLQLSSTRATTNVVYAFQKRANALKRLLGVRDAKDGSSTKMNESNAIDADSQDEKPKQLQIFISEISKTWVVLEKLETTDERVAFLVCLQSEISNHSNNYSPGQLQIIKIKTDSNDGNLLTAPVWFIPWYELIVNQWNRVGNGGFGSVYRAKWLDSEVVVKQADYPGGDSDPTKRDEARRMFMSEVNIWFRLSHPHVVRLFGACHIGAPFFVCEFAPNGALDDYLALHPDEIWQKLREAALGLLYLHECGIIHCDLKCNNVVIGSDGKTKVTDFGLSSIADTTESDTPGAHVSGAWHWVAPEVLMGSAPTRDSDVYSFGMCIVQALRVIEVARTFSANRQATLPWVVNGFALDNIVVKVQKKRGKLPSRPISCTDAQWELIKKLCRLNPSERIPICVVVDELEALPRVREMTIASDSDLVQPMSDTTAEIISSLQSTILSKKNAGSGPSRSGAYRMLEALWSRLGDLHHRIKGNEVAEHRFGLFIAEAQTKTMKFLSTAQITLLQITENELASYGLHRRLDKFMAAHFAKVPDEDECGKHLHNWKTQSRRQMRENGI